MILSHYNPERIAAQAVIEPPPVIATPKKNDSAKYFENRPKPGELKFPGIMQMETAGWRRGMPGRKFARKKYLHGKSF